MQIDNTLIYITLVLAFIAAVASSPSNYFPTVQNLSSFGPEAASFAAAQGDPPELVPGL